MSVLSAMKYGVAVLLVQDYDERIWVAERVGSKPHMRGLLECPGGTCEEGETPLETAQREVLEEAGLYVRPERFEDFGCIVVNGWRIWLYVVRLRNVLTIPQNSEPDQRGPWRLAKLEELQPRSCVASLGCFAALLLEERRKRDHEAKHEGRAP